MQTDNIGIGKRGEDIAADILTKKGYKILERNFHSRQGEIDIVALHKNTAIFVEVKTRTSTSFGLPEEAVTPRKLRSFLSSVAFYQHTHPKLTKQIQIDVISIMLDKKGEPVSINHLPNVTS